ncbi:MAG: helix-turn-helix domain-containing protein [Gemmatimonadota bacterium]|nr:MAG: helix-turn-helix domain-containing protein [Gemmatimonadota bacterium]
MREGRASARELRRAHILLLADEGLSDRRIAETLDLGRSTVERTRKKHAEGGLERALNERPRSGRPRKLDGRQEAFLVELASSDPPPGQVRWTMQLLADTLVELEIVDEISDETVRRTLRGKTT